MQRPDADLIRTLEAASYHPLWDRYRRITPMARLSAHSRARAPRRTTRTVLELDPETRRSRARVEVVKADGELAVAGKHLMK